MQPKSYVNPKIALLNVELELKAEKENAEIRVDNVAVSVNDLIWRNTNALYECIKQSKQSMKLFILSALLSNTNC